MKVKLDLIIDFESGDFEDFEDIRETPHMAAEHLYDERLLSSGADCFIKSCTHEVALLEA